MDRSLSVLAADDGAAALPDSWLCQQLDDWSGMDRPVVRPLPLLTGSARVGAGVR